MDAHEIEKLIAEWERESEGPPHVVTLAEMTAPDTMRQNDADDVAGRSAVRSLLASLHAGTRIIRDDRHGGAYTPVRSIFKAWTSSLVGYESPLIRDRREQERAYDKLITLVDNVLADAERTRDAEQDRSDGE